MKPIWGIFVLLGASALCSIAQQPKINNAQVTTETVGSRLSDTVNRFRQEKTARWLGYQISVLPKAHSSSCSGWQGSGDGCCGEYSLESGDELKKTSSNNNAGPSHAVNLFLRFDSGKLTKVRFVDEGCPMNGSGQSIVWLTGVKGDDSAKFLGSLVSENIENSSSNLLNELFVSISLHESSEATKVLGNFTSSSYPFKVREKGIFWLGAQRGSDGFQLLKDLARKEEPENIKEKIAFALSLNSDPGAVDELIHMAKTDPSPQARSKATFWLAVKANKKASAAVSDVAEKDPEVEVKKHAVFALSRLPKEEGVPKLIHVAQSSSSLEVRKAAIFWLGQSQDQKALDYLTSVLKQ